MPYTPGEVNQDSVILVDIEVGHRIDQITLHDWTQDVTYTNVWWISHTHTDKFGEHEGKPSRVVVNGVALTWKDTVAECQATPAMRSTWTWVPGTNRLYIHVVGDDDPNGGNYIIVAYLWRRFGTRPYVFAGRPYLPLVGKNSIPPVAYVTGGYHEGGTKQTFGSLKFLNGEGYFDTDLTDYIYEGKRLMARIGKNGQEFTGG
jgi:hypothetical protein